MSKVKVPVYGTVGKAVVFDPQAGVRAEVAVAALAAQISAGIGGTIFHHNLRNLQVGDDHPQYTMWQAPETVQATWNFAAEPEVEGVPLTEFIQDVVGDELVENSTSISWTYGDTANTLQAHIIDEYVQDLVGAMLADSTSIDFTYNDLAGTFTASAVNANPTASVGLTAVNGTAATPMRSDGAPALDQGIVPTWTGNHTWTDNDEVRLGTGGDLRLYHDATNSFIRNDTGILNFNIGATSWMNIDTSGRVTIGGAVDVGARLVVRGAGAQAVFDSASASDARQEFHYNSVRKALYAWDTASFIFQADSGVDTLFRVNGIAYMMLTSGGAFAIRDGITAPSAITDFASIYVDVADGDLKVKFADGTVKTIATDT